MNGFPCPVCGATVRQTITGRVVAHRRPEPNGSETCPGSGSRVELREQRWVWVQA